MDNDDLLEWVGTIVIIVIGLAIVGVLIGGAYYLIVYIGQEVVPATRGFWETALAAISIAAVIAALAWISISVAEWFDRRNGRSKEHRRIKEAKVRETEEHRLIEEAQAKKAEEERCVAEIQREKAKEDRLIKEAEAKKAEAARLFMEAEAEKTRADAQRAVNERARVDAEARTANDALLKAKALEQATANELKRAEAELKRAEAERDTAEARKAVAVAEAKIKEDELKALEEQAKICAAEQAEQEARLKAAENERQNRLNDYPLPLMVDAFLVRGEVASSEWMDNGHRENKVFTLYETLKTALQKIGRVPLEKREEVTKAMMIANQVDTILDLYAEKIERTRKNKKMSEEQRERKAQALEEARDRYIEKLLSS